MNGGDEDLYKGCTWIGLCVYCMVAKANDVMRARSAVSLPRREELGAVLLQWKAADSGLLVCMCKSSAQRSKPWCRSSLWQLLTPPWLFMTFLREAGYQFVDCLLIWIWPVFHIMRLELAVGMETTGITCLLMTLYQGPCSISVTYLYEFNLITYAHGCKVSPLWSHWFALSMGCSLKAHVQKWGEYPGDGSCFKYISTELFSSLMVEGNRAFSLKVGTVILGLGSAPHKPPPWCTPSPNFPFRFFRVERGLKDGWNCVSAESAHISTVFPDLHHCAPTTILVKHLCLASLSCSRIKQPK